MVFFIHLLIDNNLTIATNIFYFAVIECYYTLDKRLK